MKRRESSRLNSIHGTKSKFPSLTRLLNEVKASGCCGFSDEEIFSMAVHCIDEPTIEIGKPITCGVVVNRHIELNEEEKAEQKALALKRFQDEELRKLQNRNSSSTKSLRSAKKPKAVKPQENKQPELSLFDL
ncbi:PcfK-like family protein [Paramuribaculum intestinale]|uniref:PcfK-like family protein n=1 Tax=Paramuribaculum intestinale TaxID=2094151 RepID=UPI000FFEABDB|nr:PcfK-like family protein [Paramuribaculum intestinale]RXE62526.1 PcfK-like protein [Muribaculaceae bacterium Isolate-004 (NCI)]